MALLNIDMVITLKKPDMKCYHLKKNFEEKLSRARFLGFKISTKIATICN
jgi:hypothetical protein